LHCPTCNYDLRGSHVERDIYRCPECGAITNREAIRLASRGGVWRSLSFTRMILFAILTFPLVALIHFLLKYSQDLFLHFFAIVAIFVVGLVGSMRWADAPWRVRVIFAIGLAMSISVGFLFSREYVKPVSGLLFVGWFLGFDIWAAIRGYEVASRRIW